MTGRRILAALLASSLIGGPAVAEPKGPSERDKQLASELVKKAIAKSTAGDHGAAIEIYRQAYKIVPNSILLSNIASEFEKSNKLVEALRYFCLYLDEDPRGTMAPYATSRARVLQLKLGNDSIDDTDVCAVALERKEPGRREPVDPEPPEDRGPRDVAPPKDPEPPAPTATDSLKYGALVSAIAGVGALGVGVYAGVRARSISDEISAHDRDDPWPGDIRAVERRGETFENIQIAGLIAGGVLATTATVLYVVRRSRSNEKSSDSAITLAPTTNGVVVLGRF
jgi:hypothetical protein